MRVENNNSGTVRNHNRLLRKSLQIPLEIYKGFEQYTRYSRVSGET